MRRRELIMMLGGAAAAWPLAGRAQQGGRVRRVGVLMPLAEDLVHDRIKLLEQGLRDRGWVVGGNLKIDYRFAGADPGRAHRDAAELVGLNPEALLAPTSVSLQPLQQATRTIPIVFVGLFDSLSVKFVSNFAHPEGNITGFTIGETTTSAKHLELLKEVAPAVDHAAVIFNPDQSPQVAVLHDLEAAAPSLGLRLTANPVREASDIEPAIEMAAREPNGGLVIVQSPLILINRDHLIALISRKQIPAIYGDRAMVASGGLLSYGVNLVEEYGPAAVYIDRLLKGAKPSDLPVQQPTKFELVINLKTAKTLNLSIPPALLATADEVIE